MFIFLQRNPTKLIGLPYTFINISALSIAIITDRTNYENKKRYKFEIILYWTFRPLLNITVVFSLFDFKGIYESLFGCIPINEKNYNLF